MTTSPTSSPTAAAPAGPPTHPRTSRRRRAAAVWGCAFSTALVLYTLTANRSVQWQDGGHQQLRMVTGRIHHELGLVLIHPVQFYLGRTAMRLLPRLEPAFAATLVSAVSGAAAVANIALVIHLLTRRYAPAAIGAAALMLSHTFWQHATRTECYGVTAALLSGEWAALAIYCTGGRGSWLVLMALLNGLGTANHLLSAMVAPGLAIGLIVAVRAGRLRLHELLGAAIAWTLGSLPYTLLVLDEYLRSGDLWGTLRSAVTSGYSSSLLSLRLTRADALLVPGYIVYNFPGLTIPLAVYALWARTRVPRLFLRIIALELAFFLVFAARFDVPDKYTFFFPAYMLLALLAGIGMAQLPDRWSPRRRGCIVLAAAATALWTPLVYWTAASVARSQGWLGAMVRNKPYRDGYRAFFIPWGVGMDYPARLNATLRALAGTHGLILLEDPMMTPALHYEQAVGRLPQTVELFPLLRTAGITQGQQPVPVAEVRQIVRRAVAAGRPVILVPYDRDRPDPPRRFPDRAHNPAQEQSYFPDARWQRVEDVYVLASAADL